MGEKCQKGNKNNILMTMIVQDKNKVEQLNNDFND